MAMKCGEAGWLSRFTDELRGRSEFRVMNEERNERIGRGQRKQENGADEIFWGL